MRGLTESARGGTIWMTGLSGAGKSTIAEALTKRLESDGHKVEILDGDEVRTYLSKGLGFSREDRDTNIRRIGFVASLLARNGVLVISAAIAPFADTRAEVRAMHERDGSPFLETYIATPVEVCAQRDVKGLYAKQAAGEMSGLTGVDDPYEAPAAPEIVVPTHEQTLEESVETIVAALAERGLL
jgi:adenylylsulfate kinase